MILKNRKRLSMQDATLFDACAEVNAISPLIRGMVIK